MHHFRRLSTPFFGSLLLCAACFGGPDRPQPRPTQPPPQVAFHPFMGRDLAAPAMRINLRPAPAIDDLVLVRGKLSSRELKDLEAGRASQSLQDRQVAFLWWYELDALVMAPETWIEPGEMLTIGAPDANWTHTFRVEDPDPPPRLQRVWPPASLASAGTFAVWCVTPTGRGQTHGAAVITPLEPGPVRGRLRPGSLEGIGRDCVSWEALEPPGQALAPPPVALLDDGRMARIDPAPIVAVAGLAEPEPGPCGQGRVSIGPACGRVMDDRVELSLESGAWWLAMRAGTVRWAGALMPDAPIIWRDLEPSSELLWEAFGIDPQGGKRAWQGQLRTEAPMGHVVINEVMANPSGEEPRQEWVELYNDGVMGVELSGWSLEDPGGDTKLPTAKLQPGRFALLVNEGYQTDGWPDPAPAEGAEILRVTKLGNQGLSNGGEPLRLRDETGRIVSGFLPRASPKPGQSIARIAPEAVDWLEGSFVSCSTSTPGAPNKL